MQLLLNGETREVAVGRLSELLQHLQIDTAAQGVAVAVNMAVVPRAEWESFTLCDGDQIDIIAPMQGG